MSIRALCETHQRYPRCFGQRAAAIGLAEGDENISKFNSSNARRNLKSDASLVSTRSAPLKDEKEEDAQTFR